MNELTQEEIEYLKKLKSDLESLRHPIKDWLEGHDHDGVRSQKLDQALQDLTALIDDTAGNGDTTVVYSADKVFDLLTGKQASGSYATLTGTETLTNKRITPRITVITSDATPTVNTDNCDIVTILAQAVDITSMTTNLSGTPTNFQKLLVRIRDDGTARGIIWGDKFENGSATLPTTTDGTQKTLLVGFIYDTAQEKWACEATGSRA
jgi:hypothetical protein